MYQKDDNSKNICSILLIYFPLILHALSSNTPWLYCWMFCVNIILPVLLERNCGFINSLILSFLPLYFKIGLRNNRWFDILHIIYPNLLSNKIWLFQPRLTVIVDIPIHNSKLTSWKSQLRPENNWFKRSQIDSLSFLQHQNFNTWWKF